MVIVNSGIVLDYYSEAGISGATVLAYTITGSSIHASGVSSSLGTFTLLCEDTDSDLIYIPLKINFIGYSIVLPINQSEITLYVREEPYPINISGTGNINISSSTLKTSQKINDIKSTSCHLYIATSGGLDILDINTLENSGYISYSGGFTSMAITSGGCFDSSILLGTSNSGILEFNIPDEYIGSLNLYPLLQPKWNSGSGTLLSNSVQCIDKNIYGSYIIGTNSGIDYYSYGGVRYYHSYGLELSTDCCGISDFEDLYYSPNGSGVYAKYGPIVSNWTTPDYRITESGTGNNPFPLLSNYINDLDLTSNSGSNSVFIASTRGFIAYDENRGDLDATASGATLVLNYP